MRKAVSILVISAMVGAAMPSDAYADGGQVAAGIIGGLAVGTILGAATAPRAYYAPAPIYVEPAPLYEGPVCYWTRGAPVWDGWSGTWYRVATSIRHSMVDCFRGRPRCDC